MSIFYSYMYKSSALCMDYFMKGNQFHCTYQICCLDNVSPVLVNLCEPSPLLGHLSHDIRRGEDWFQIEPCGLYFQPLVDDLLHQEQLTLPISANTHHYRRMQGIVGSRRVIMNKSHLKRYMCTRKFLDL